MDTETIMLSEQKILILDDKYSSELSSMLIKTGVRPSNLLSANSGISAIEKIKIFSPNVVFVKLNLKLMSGADFITYIRENNLLKDSKLFVILNEESIKKHKYITDHIDDFIELPYSYNNIIQVLNKSLVIPK